MHNSLFTDGALTNLPNCKKHQTSRCLHCDSPIAPAPCHWYTGRETGMLDKVCYLPPLCEWHMRMFDEHLVMLLYLEDFVIYVHSSPCGLTIPPHTPLLCRGTCACTYMDVTALKRQDKVCCFEAHPYMVIGPRGICKNVRPRQRSYRPGVWSNIFT